MTQDAQCLRASDLTMQVDRDTGFLRCIRLGDREVLRGVYAAVRDRNWGTVSPKISDFAVEPDGSGGMRAAFHARCTSDEVDLAWRGTVTVRGSEITYAFDGRALKPFLRNRIGLCVLHPIRECAGQPCTVVHSGGVEDRAAFPAAISPHQPFLDLRSIAHEVRPGVRATAIFEGDVFETEDQRNWSDNSFKTYSTPLALPFPVRVAAGERMSQTVTLSLTGLDEGRVSTAPSTEHHKPVVLRRGRACHLPRLGLCLPSRGPFLSEAALVKLRELHLDHLRVELDLSDGGWASTLARADRVAAALGISLHLALHLGDHVEADLRRVAGAVRRMESEISAWLVFQRGQATTPGALVSSTKLHLACLGGAGLVAAGTNAYFAELNRGGESPTEADAVVYSVNPQVHATDTASLVETLQTQAEMVTCARAIAEERPVLVSPVTLRPRFNPNAMAEGDLPPARVDPRQATPFPAGWTLGSIAALAAGGAWSTTYFETTGARGVMDVQGGPYPVWSVFRDLAHAKAGEITLLESDAPLRLLGVVAEGSGGSQAMLANLTGEAQPMSLEGMTGADARRLVLGPYEYKRLRLASA